MCQRGRRTTGRSRKIRETPLDLEAKVEVVEQAVEVVKCQEYGVIDLLKVFG